MNPRWLNAVVWLLVPFILFLLTGCLQLQIVEPVSGDEILAGERIEFRVRTEEAQESKVRWLLDGKLIGTGKSLTTSSLPVGWHEVKAELREGNKSVSDTVHVQIISWNAIKSPHRAPATAIARDEIGKETWLAVPGEGVYRVNVNGEFKLFSVSSGDLPTADVRDLILYDQEIWVATGIGVAHYVESDWRVFGRQHGLPSDDVRALYADSATSRLWLVTPLGLASWDGRSWESIPHLSPATSLAVHGDVAWVGTDGGEIHRLSGKIWNRLTPEEERQGESIQFLVPDGFQPDQVWLASRTKGLAKGHDGGREYLLGDHFEPLRTNGIVVEEASGTLWIAEANSLGILRRSATGVWRRYDAKSVLPFLEGSWQAITVDQATGTKWLATHSHIVSLSLSWRLATGVH